MTGSGTFESYVGVGSGCAATPDGRLKGQPIASDCSQQPYPQVCLDRMHGSSVKYHALSLFYGLHECMHGCLITSPSSSLLFYNNMVTR